MTYKVVYDRTSQTTRIELDEIIVTPIPVTDWDSVLASLDDYEAPTILTQVKGLIAMLVGDLALVISLVMVIVLGIAIAKIFI